MSENVKQRKRRTFLGRSSKGCLTCKERRVKCDESYPCGNCIRIERSCPGPPERALKHIVQRASNLTALSRTPDRIAAENDVLYRFMISLSMQFGGYYDERFWTTSLSASQGYDEVHNALLAVSTIYFIPMSESIDPGALPAVVPSRLRLRYQKAQEWYSTSVQRTMTRTSTTSTTTFGDVLLLLTTTILYIYVELRQGRSKNLQQLYQTAFAVIHSARDTLIRSKDPAVLSCLGRLLDFAFTTRINGALVPRIHWQTALLIGHSLALQISGSEFFQIQFDLSSIMYDIENFMLQDPDNVSDVDTNEHTLTFRLQRWSRTMTAFETSEALNVFTRMHLNRLKCRWSLYNARWKVLQVAGNPSQHRKLLEKPASQYLGFYEDMLRLASRPPYCGALPLYLLEMTWVPACILSVWHFRDETMVSRAVNMLQDFHYYEQDDFLASVTAYLHTLAKTRYDEATEVEMQLFGRRPEWSIRLWQCHLISQHLLRNSGQVSRTEKVLSLTTSWTSTY